MPILAVNERKSRPRAAFAFVRTESSYLGRAHIALAAPAHPLHEAGENHQDRPRDARKADRNDVQRLKQEEEAEQDDENGHGLVVSAGARRGVIHVIHT